MKRLVIFLLVIFTFSGCTSEVVITGEGYDFENDDQYYFDKAAAESCSLAAANEGYCFFGGPQNMFLYYMDKSTMKPVLMCNKPDCMHTEENNPEKISSCNAFFNNANFNLIYNKSSMYTLSMPTGSSFALCQASQDATKRHSLYDFRDFLSFMIIHRSYAYYIVNDPSAFGKAGSPIKSYVYRINLNNLNTKPDLVFTCEGYRALMHDIKGYGGFIYFSTSYYEDADFTVKHDYIYRYNIISKTCNKVSENGSKFTFSKASLIYNGENKQIYLCNLDGSESKKIDGVIGYPNFADDQYIYTTAFTTNTMDFVIYKLGGGVCQTFHLTPAFTICGHDDKYLFIYETDSNDWGFICRLFVIDKSRLATGSASMEKVYEYVPTHEFPGVITH